MAASSMSKFLSKCQISRIVISSNSRYFVRQQETRSFHLSHRRPESFNIQDAADFKTRVLDSKIPVVVDFHASWCGPCKMLAPRLETVMLEFKDKMHFAKVDIDENADLALDYGVEAVPAVLGIKDGEVVERFIGLQDEDKIRTFVKKTFSS